ncbi:MAG TPA: hypothetical protein VIX59_15140 [Candidatus Binataceae bacterium]
MRLCVGTLKGIVILDPARATPIMVLADPSAVWCMAQDCSDPLLIYAGATAHVRNRGALSRSDDGGRTWTDISPGLAREEEVWALAAAPEVKGRVFIGTSHARILRSDDRGSGFKECVGFLRVPGRDKWSFPPPPHIPHVRSISFDPRDSATMYVGVEEGGVYRSRDGGETFESLNEGLYEDVHTVAVDPRDSHRLYATTGRGFYLSKNAGASWTHVRQGINRSYTVPLLVRGADAGAIYTAAAAGPPPTWQVSGADAMLFRSDDRGESFKQVRSDGAWTRGMIMRLRQDPEGGEFFGVSTDGSVLRASNDGAGITTIADKLPPAYDLVTLP